MTRSNSAKASRSHSRRESDSQENLGKDTKPIKKIDAAKAAIHEGFDSPQRAVAYIAKRYGIEIDPQHFSSIKSQLKKKLEATQSEMETGSKASGAVEGYLAPPPSPRPATGEPDLLDAMQSIKTLIAELGADKVKRIVDLLG
ncbi:thioesterase [Singulisphaera sp. Ch08]|uniref:Thioesterase n=1 Tax=Singulisphaera sp. Ch08 TaxID=3120278 RepID=A0AAU7CLC2_9BACT